MQGKATQVNQVAFWIDICIGSVGHIADETLGINFPLGEFYLFFTIGHINRVKIMQDYKNEQIWLMNGDCLERMKEIPSGSVDMILTVCYY